MTVLNKVFPATDEALDGITAYLEEKLEEYGASMKTVMQLTVVLEEVFVNVAHYAYDGGVGDVVFGLDFDEADRTLTMQFTDKGKPFDPLAKPDPDITLSAEERNIGGLGIFMVKKTMDTVEYEYRDGQNILTLKKVI